jgi:hypothetical protein
MAQIEKKDTVLASIPGLIFGAFIGIAAIFAAGGLAVIAIKWFVSLIKGGL